MKKYALAAMIALGCTTVGFAAGTVHAQQGQEAAMHPRLATAISALVDARAYLQAAPHDFGGHKVSAISAIDAALVELRAALAFRGAVDRGHGRIH